MPPSAGNWRTSAHGAFTVSDSGVWEISGAVTLLSSPCCGQFRVAVVCTTGSSGVATDSRKPTRPATTATQRVSVRSRSVTGAVMAVLESVRAGSSR